MIRINNVFERVDSISNDYALLISEKLRIPTQQIGKVILVKKSIDARKKNDVRFCYSFFVELKNASLEKRLIKQTNDVQKAEIYDYSVPCIKTDIRPVVVGFGPAGMFCAYVLAKAGLHPIVIERGSQVEKRIRDVSLFRTMGILNTESNIQYGEGGAGTFSDGKLNTGIKDKRIGYVLKTFCEFGAPQNIVTDAKPHIGTDVLAEIVKGIRNKIIELGGEIRFDTRFDSFTTDDGVVNAIRVRHQDNKVETLHSRYLVLAIGHSARDTVEFLQTILEIEKKAFSIGVRIEHKQEWLNKLQYGSFSEYLPAADYKINCKTEKGRGVYSFCMCPGGYVVASSSEEETVVTNGMSYSERSGENCNAAVLVSVLPDDFPSDDPLSGYELQNTIERSAFQEGGGNYFAPAQKVGDFLKLDMIKNENTDTVESTYRPGVRFTDLHSIFPEYITEALEDAIIQFDKKLPGFANPNAVLTAPETRSSSPIRIKRNETGESTRVIGVFPCGEGAGYAGGIMSSAVDGIKIAEQIIERVLKEER